MLRQLKISNFAIIDNLEIDFDKGLTILTGETGAGKSIIMGALSLILGEKADLKSIRNSEKKSVVEAVFDIGGYGLKPLFDDNDIDYFSEECIMRREISVSGRTRAFVNDIPVTLQVMRGIAMRLVDIHSQHSNLLLSQHSYQLSVLDSMSGNVSVKERYQEEYKKYRHIEKSLAQLKERSSKNRAEEDYMRFQLTQLSELKLEEDEDTQLQTEEKKLSNVSEIKSALWSSESLLDGDERSIISDIATIAQDISRIVPIYSEVGDLSERISSVRIELKDIARTLSMLQNDLVDDPEELERIQNRLDAIYSLENKHKLSSVNELLELQHKYEQELSEIENSDDEIARLEEELKHQTAIAEKAAKELSDRRKAATKAFTQELVNAAAPLGMKNLRFEVGFEEVQMGADGTDAVSFLASFNKQQALTAVETTASGGEISRLMLCVKYIMAQSMKLPTIIFDEVDTGVSGDVANRMGDLMKSISQNIQVITITHLPQVAVKGDSHFKVYKEDTDSSTFTSIKRLEQDERVNEIATMLSGESVDEASINNARSLLGIK